MTQSLLVFPFPLSAFPHPPPRTRLSSSSSSSTQTHLSNSEPLSLFSSLSSRNIGVNSSDSKKEPLFLDENGVVDDMEGYLDHLSLEYDSVWDTKPSWCQPWTITLTGASIIAISWFVLHSVVVTSVTSTLILAWWYIFLYSYPKAYSDMIAERREKVTNGVEDTFGRRKKQ